MTTPTPETPAGGLTTAEREQWDVDPDEWPHTPPFHVFRALMDEDDNTWWRAGSGHGLNAYDAAIERVEELEQARAEDRARIEAAWDEGYTAGHSNAMRRMSDEPTAPTSPNPYRAATEDGERP